MKESIFARLEHKSHRFEELEHLLGTEAVLKDTNQFKALSKEYADLRSTVELFAHYCSLCEQIAENEALLGDPELKELAREELPRLTAERDALSDKLQLMLLPADPDDDKDVFLEIRAGAGGDEASIFVGDLFRMYSRYCQTMRWQLEIINENAGEHGGFKEIIARITGDKVYAKLKFESGAHRVQRVPATESQGRIHTSTCTVAVLPEADELEEIKIDPSDLRIDTFRASGAGGQHVNRTDSAIRITHIPTGVVVECQDERSQHKNRAKAMSVLQAKLVRAEREKHEAKEAATRKQLVGTGDRSERIRTYNFPQGRLTDHRVNLTLYQLEDIMEGDLAPVVEPLIREYQTEQLNALRD